jgi:hypothetical protein
MKYTAIAVAIIAILACGVSYGQDQQPEQVKALGSLIGCWESPYVAEEEMPDIGGKPGDTGTMRMAYSWILGKHRVKWETTIHLNGKSKVFGHAIIGLDKEGQLRSWWFGPNFVSFASWETEGDTWIVKTDDGDLWVFDRPASGTYKMTMKQSKGEKVDGPVIVSKRLASK